MNKMSDKKEQEKIQENEGASTNFEAARKNPWMLAAIILGIALVLALFFAFKGGATGKVISGSEAGKALTDFLNQQTGGGVNYVSNVDMGSIYEVTVSYQGNDIPVYITKDGKYFIQGAVEIKEMMEAVPKTNTQTQPTAVAYSSEDLAKIKTFVSCLEQKKFKIYGANWCGWTKKLVVDTFGGFDVVKPIYVECTEEEELCSKEGVTGYPTIKLDGKAYSGQRTFADIAKATGCSAPSMNVQAASASASTTDANCADRTD